MIYAVTTIDSSFMVLYRGWATASSFHPGPRITVPTGVAMLPADGEWSSTQIDRRTRLQHRVLTDLPKGGHFAALEQPEQFLHEMTFFRKVRA